MILVVGGAKRSAFSFGSHLGIPSGHCALAGLIEHNFLKIENSDSGEKSSLINKDYYFYFMGSPVNENLEIIENTVFIS